jgi:ribosome modulation factor
MNYSIDGNQVCVVDEGFRDLQLDHAGFGDSLCAAFCDYWRTLDPQSILSKPDLRDLKEWELDWVSLLPTYIMDYERPYTSGRTAYLAGEIFASNPIDYHSNANAYSQWSQGWRDAHKGNTGGKV